MVPEQIPESRQVAEIIQAMAGEAGLRHEDRGDGVRDLAQGIRAGPATQAFFLAWSGRVDPDGNLYIFQQDPRRRRTRVATSNPDVDRWLDEARTKSDAAPSARRYTRRCAEKVLSEGAIVYLYHRLMIIAHTAKLDGYKQMPDGLIRLTGATLK